MIAYKFSGRRNSNAIIQIAIISCTLATILSLFMGIAIGSLAFLFIVTCIPLILVLIYINSLKKNVEEIQIHNNVLTIYFFSNRKPLAIDKSDICFVVYNDKITFNNCLTRNFIGLVKKRDMKEPEKWLLMASQLNSISANRNKKTRYDDI